MEGKPLYRTLAAVGFLSHLLAMLVLLPNVTEPRPFLLIVAVIDVIGLVTVTRFGWGRWTGLVCAVLVTLATFWLVFSLLALRSVVDFLAGLAGFLGYVTALVATILNLSANRRAKLATGGHQRSVAIVAGAVVALTVVSAVLTLTGAETVPDAEAAGATEVLMKNDEFVPRDLTASTGAPTRFLVHNSDRVAHTFTVKGSDLNEIVMPGSETIVTFPARAAGNVEYVCEFHAGMKGTITVG